MFRSLLLRAPKSTTSKTAKVAVEGTRSKNANGLTFLQQQKADAQAERQFLNDLLARVPQKPPRSSYALFQKQTSVGDVPFDELAKEYSQAWAELTESKKESYQRDHEKLVEKYNVDLAAFKKSLKKSEKDALDTIGFELPRVKSTSARGPNKWLQFVAEYRRQHPTPAEKTGTEVYKYQSDLMKEASKAYKKA